MASPSCASGIISLGPGYANKLHADPFSRNIEAVE